MTDKAPTLPEAPTPFEQLEYPAGCDIWVIKHKYDALLAYATSERERAEKAETLIENGRFNGLTIYDWQRRAIDMEADLLTAIERAEKAEADAKRLHCKYDTDGDSAAYKAMVEDRNRQYERAEAMAKLKTIVEAFVVKHEIIVAESIYQTDSVIEDAAEFIEQLVNEVGYFTFCHDCGAKGDESHKPECPEAAIEQGAQRG